MNDLSDYLLCTRGLTKRFGHHHAVDHVNLHIPKGAIYGFIGRNGAGKTTCLKMISGLSKPTEGEIEIFGYSGRELEHMRSRIGCLIEAPGLYENMTAYENLKTKCLFCGIHKKGYIEDILETVGLGDTLQRLQQERNMTILISSHILEELSKIATDYGIIHNGALLQELTREELMQRCSERIEITLDHPEGALPVLDRLGFSRYQVTDKNHIQVFERLNESPLLNMELSKAGILFCMNVMVILYSAVDKVAAKLGISDFVLLRYTVTGRMALLDMAPSAKACGEALAVAIVLGAAVTILSSQIFRKRDI